MAGEAVRDGLCTTVKIHYKETRITMILFYYRYIGFPERSKASMPVSGIFTFVQVVRMLDFHSRDTGSSPVREKPVCPSG